MYSDDYDSLDDEALVPRKSKTTPSPPPVYSYKDLEAFRFSTKHVIVCAVDFETVDNYVGSDVEKMSEIGVALYDPRITSSPYRTSETTPTTSQSNTHLEDLGRSVIAHHILVDEWKHETEMTCKAFWHKGRKNKSGKPHKARPYHCQFARSTVLSRDESINWLKALLRRLTTQNRTAEEIENGDEREVRLLFWDSGLEDRIFYQADIHLPELGKDIQGWDLQAWCPFRIRFNNGVNNGQASGEMAFASLGVLGTKSTTVLHNATNDTVAQLLSFLRMTVMTEDEWKAWFDERVDFAPISFDWVDQGIYDYNISLRPDARRQNVGHWGKGKHPDGKHEKRSQHGSFRNKNHSNARGPKHGSSHLGARTTSQDCHSHSKQFLQQKATAVQEIPTSKEENAPQAATKVASLTEAVNNLNLHPSGVQTLSSLLEVQAPEKKEDQNLTKQGGLSRKQRQRKNKAAKREEGSRKIPGLA
ncbi:hypothetical protein QR685DRAFT_557294 [Neurospora intermedia]|uniref:QDE-2-interacting protein n=1 Tax=Neurospora intermedia TaxID=5142 RepID=A0ABR3D3S9_NEUIN